MDENQLIVNEAAFFDKAATIYLLARLNRKFTKWPAYKLGLIDEDGNIIKNPETSEEKKALGAFDKLILRIRKILPSAAMKALSAVSIYKVLKEDERLPENIKFKNESMIYLFEKMIMEAEDRGLDRNEVMEWLQNGLDDYDY